MDFSSIIPLVYEVVREKNVHEDDVFFAIEHALLSLARDRYGYSDLSVRINRSTGEIVLLQKCVVSAKPTSHTEISLEKAQLIDAEVKVGGSVELKLPFEDFPRIGAHMSINLLYKKLEELRRIREFNEFTGREGEIVSCVVKQTFHDGQLIVTIGKGLGVLYRNDLIPSEINKYKPGDYIKAYLKEVTNTAKYQLILSRTHNRFLSQLLTLQVPELASGEIVVKKVVRLPGRRAKVAVDSDNKTVDPVRLCVGQAGKRIEPVVEELLGERIDIVPWSDNVINFAVHALKPASVQQVIFRANNLILVVPDDQKKKAIGEFGSNVKLASALTGANLSVLTSSEAELRKAELQTFFEKALEIDSDISSLLVNKGFETIHDINNTANDALSEATEMDESLVEAIKERASIYTEETRDFFQSVKADLDKALLEIPGLKTLYIKELYHAGIKTLDALALQTKEHIVELLKDYKITALSVDRFITYAKKRTGRITTIQSNPSRPDTRYVRTSESHS